jgi:hypothetical protein
VNSHAACKGPAACTDYVEIRFAPRRKYAPVVRAFVRSVLGASVQDTRTVVRAVVAVSELLENAVKHASSQETMVRIHVQSGEQGRVTVSVENRATADAIRAFQSSFAETMHGDALERYVECVRQAALRTDGKSRIGLSRVRYESQARMRLDVTDPDKVKVTLQLG